MANTKKLARPERKQAKRALRKDYKKIKGGLTRKQRVELRKSGKSLKVFLAEAKKSAE